MDHDHNQQKEATTFKTKERTVQYRRYQSWEQRQMDYKTEELAPSVPCPSTTKEEVNWYSEETVEVITRDTRGENGRKRPKKTNSFCPR